MSTTVTIETIINDIKDSQFTFISGTYKSYRNNVLLLKCNRGHKLHYTLVKLRQDLRAGCRRCNKEDKIDSKYPVGKKIGKLTILRNTNNSPRKGYLQLQCQCNKIVYRTPQIFGQISKISSCLQGECHPRYVQVMGKTFGLLTPIEKLEIPINKYNKSSTYLFKCKCGNEVIKDLIYLAQTPTPSCGCIRYGKGEKNHVWKGFGEIPGTYFNMAQKGARDRKMEFTINIEYAWNLYTKQNGKCKLSGLPIDFGIDRKNKAGYRDITASLDRIDSKKGYIKNNVQWLHKRVNIMKNKLEEEEFIFFCKAIANNCVLL
jgi:hypothetical protein